MQITSNLLNQSWKQFLDQFSRIIDKSEVDAWLNKLTLVEFSPQRISLGGLNHFFCNWIREHYRDTLRQNLIKVFQPLKIQNDFQLVLEIGEDNLDNHFIVKNNNKTTTIPSGLQERYTLESFVEGNNNHIAYAAAQAIAKNFQTNKYNPLFLYGNIGVGKTHLIQAIGLGVLKKNPEAQVLYVSSEQFTNEVIQGFRTGTINQVRQKYRSVDLLLIDEIQFFENKQSTQEEFLHTLNDLIQHNKQVVITANLRPCNLQKISKRLQGLLSAGIITQIKPPDFDTRYKIIKQAIQHMQLDVSDQIIQMITNATNSNLHDIRGILIRMEAEWSLLGKSIDKTTIKHILKDVLNIETSLQSIDAIVKFVCVNRNIDYDDLLSNKRQQKIVITRQMAIYLVWKTLSLPYIEIAKYFHRRTDFISKACDKIKTLIKTDESIAVEINSLFQELKIK